MDRFRLYIVFLVLHVHLLNSIVIQVTPRIRAKDLYLSVSNASAKKTHVDAEKMLNLRPAKPNSYSRQNESFLQNQRIFKIDNSTKPATGSFSRSVIRRAPPPYAYIVHQTRDVRPIYETETDSTVGLAENHHTGYSYDPQPITTVGLPENHHTGYSYDPPSVTNDLSNKYDSKNLKGSYTPEEIVAAIEKLDRLLKPILNSDSYNSSLHPPTNPVLSLILSRYGRYLSGPNSNIYSYMAVNNIHNIKPFGQYKHE